MQTSKTGTRFNGIIQMIFADKEEYDTLISTLQDFVESMQISDKCVAIDATDIIHELNANFLLSDPLYKNKPTTYLDDDMMHCLLNVTLATVREWEVLAQQNS